MICMELENDKMDNVSPTPNETTEIIDKSKNQYEKKICREQKSNHKLKVQSWDHKNRDSLRNFYIDLLLNKRGIFIKSSKPEDFASRCMNAEPRGEIKSVLAERLKYKRRKKELERKKREILKAKTEKRERLKKNMGNGKKRLTKLVEKTNNSQPVKDNLDTLLAKIQINT